MSKTRKAEIEIRRGAAGESAYVGQSRVRVSDIARQYALAQDELVVEKLQSWLPTLTKEQISAALEYWRAHAGEIEEEIAEEERLLAQIPYAE